MAITGGANADRRITARIPTIARVITVSLLRLLPIPVRHFQQYPVPASLYPRRCFYHVVSGGVKGFRGCSGQCGN